MPRNLNDLFEAAVSTAPPERHHAADITHLAQRAQRRRTTLVAAAASLAVAVVAGVAVAITQHHPSTPEPAQQFKRNQTVDVSSAVPVGTLPGYHREPWTLPSVQNLGHDRGPLPTYLQVDADGRVVIQGLPGGDARNALSLRVFDGPGLGPRAVTSPPSPGTNAGNPVAWIPSFQSDGRLLWYRTAGVFGSQAGIHLTDLDGGHDVFVHTHVQLGTHVFTDVVQPWVSGDRFWFTSFDSATLKGTTYSLYSSTFSGQVTKVAENLAAADVNGGIAAWVPADGRVVVTQSTAGGSKHTVPIPFTRGCHAVPILDLQSTGTLQPMTVSRSVIALPEECGGDKAKHEEMLAFDQAGHLLVHITGLFSFSPLLGAHDLVFRGLLLSDLRKSAAYRYDLVTGTLARLSPPSASRTATLLYPQAAGDYVLWYGGDGGHVAKIP